MKEKLKSKINLVIIFIVTCIVLYFALKDDFKTIILKIITIDIKWLLVSFLLILSYYYLRTIVLNTFIKQFQKKYRFRDTFSLILKTQFFNGVTPFATGGQPFQVYMLKKEGIKITNATNIIIQNFIVYQIALVLLGFIAVITNHYMHLFNDIPLLKKLVTLGFIINILVTVFLFIIAFTVKSNRVIGTFGIKILKGLRIVKKPEEAMNSWKKYVENFHDGAIILLQNKKDFIKGIFYNFIALCALYLIPLALLYGIGEFHLINSYETIIASAYVMLIGSFVPIPGGTGGLEYGFIAFYGNYIKGANLKSIMLLWRFITYYLGMILGAISLNINKRRNNMRIGIFTDTYPPYINGVSTSVAMLEHALRKKGHQVYIVTVNPENMTYKYEDDDHIIRIPGIPIGIYDYRLTGIYPLKALKKIKKWNLDVIHSHTEFGVGTFARIISKQFDIPLVHTYHTMYEDYIHYITKGYFLGPSRKIVEYLTKFYCDQTATELIVPTKKTYDLFKKKYKYDRNVHIIPTGIEIERFYKENFKESELDELRKKLKIKKTDFVTLFVGRLAQEKSVDVLIEVQASICKKYPHAKLLIIGDGPDMDKFKKQAIKLKIENNVIFTGKVPWKEVPKYYNLSSIFATASKTETQGLTVIEAMAASIPVVCVLDESFSTVVIDGLNGYLFKNKRQYKIQVEYLIENPKQLKKMGDQARINSESYSSKYFAERVLDVYKIAVGINNQPSKKGFLSRFKKVVGKTINGK